MTHENDALAPVAEIHAELENGALPEYDLEDSSFLLPTKIDRAGLSRMINDLLGLEEPVAFDIYFKDEPLRTTLAAKLEEHKVQSETTIKLVYTLAITQPEEVDLDTQNDWIAGVAFTSHLAHFATACFDGNVSLYSASDTSGASKVAEFVTANKSASAIAVHSAGYGIAVGITPKYLRRDIGDALEIVVGQMNGLLEVYFVDAGAKKHARTLAATSESDTDVINSIAIDASGKTLAVAGNAKEILLYDNATILQRCKKEAKQKATKAKRGLENDTVQPKCRLAKHTKAVMGLKFVELQTGVLVSAGMDGLVAVWDVANGALLSSYSCGKAITCMDVSPDCAEVFTGHEEGTLAAWDLRGKGDGAAPKKIGDLATCNLTRTASTAMFDRLTTAIKVNPAKNTLLAAIALDGTAVLLDKRSLRIPLQTVNFKDNNEPDRGTGCCWISPSELLCTTAAGAIRKLNFKELT